MNFVVDTQCFPNGIRTRTIAIMSRRVVVLFRGEIGLVGRNERKRTMSRSRELFQRLRSSRLRINAFWYFRKRFLFVSIVVRHVVFSVFPTRFYPFLIPRLCDTVPAVARVRIETVGHRKLSAFVSTTRQTLLRTKTRAVGTIKRLDQSHELGNSVRTHFTFRRNNDVTTRVFNKRQRENVFCISKTDRPLLQYIYVCIDVQFDNTK